MVCRTRMDPNCILPLLALCSFIKLLGATYSDENPEQEHLGNHGDTIVSRYGIITAQFDCFQKILREPSHIKTGTTCNRTWDGWLCWEETEAGVTTEQPCPEYYHDFSPKEMASKECGEGGYWGLHPDSSRIWTNFTQCRTSSSQGRKTEINLFYLVLIGHGLSLTSLLVSLGIFFYFKTLSCQRITLHKNLFISFVLNSVITIIWFTTVANDKESYTASCKLTVFIHLYLMSCNYFWMLCEGIYLHTLIVVAVFAEKQHLMWYYLLGWGFPLVPALMHAVARYYYYNDDCWIRSDTSLLYIIHGPICAALLVNLFFLLNIVRVLITKLKVTHQTESSLYMKAVRATLILVPLLGIQFVLLPYKPQGLSLASEIFEYIMGIFMHYQGLLVATIFCFFNGEVQTVLRRHWNQQRLQFGGTFAHGDIFRSASYVASSLTEVHRCYSIESHTEYLNGKSYDDIRTTIHRASNPFDNPFA